MDSYNMDHDSRGYCLIINNVEFDEKTKLTERKGSDKDASDLYDVFDKLSFDMLLKRNLSRKQTQDTIEKSKKTSS